MEYLDVEEARERDGLRLALTVGGPGPWSEAAKGVFHCNGVPFAPVRQDSGDPNAELEAWTGHRNAPVAIYEDEPARATWSEILLLAERLGGEPRLLPPDPATRAMVLGLCHEICGEEGLGWSRRLLMLDGVIRGREAAGKSVGRMGFMAGLYGYARERVARAERRAATLLTMFSERLHAQRKAGSEYLVGTSFTAVDLYWACFAAMFAPLPHDLCPMPTALRTLYTVSEGPVATALDPELLIHRDRIYERHLILPLDF